MLPMLQSAPVKQVESRVRVRYKETDAMGIAHHSNYIVWFEIGRTDFCRETGIPYAEIERRGYVLVVGEIRCRYMTPFRYDEEVVIRTSVGALGSRAIEFTYELFSVDEELRATGSSWHIWLDLETRKPVRADQEVRRAFERFIRG